MCDARGAKVDVVVVVVVVQSGRYLRLLLLLGVKEEAYGLMVLRVRPTPTRFPINILYTPVNDTPLHSTQRARY